MTETHPGNSANKLIKRRSLGLSRRKRFNSVPNQPSKDPQVTDSSSSSNFHSVSETICTQKYLNKDACVKIPAKNLSSDTIDQQQGIIVKTPIAKACSESTTTSSSCKQVTIHHHAKRSTFSSSNTLCKSVGTIWSQSPTLSSTPISRTRMGLHRSGRKRFKTNIQPPIPDKTSGEVASNADDNVNINEVDDMDSLREESSKLQQEIEALRTEGLDEAELQVHMRKMHEYNELKDTGQMLIGKIAFLEGVTTKDLYNNYGLDLED